MNKKIRKFNIHKCLSIMLCLTMIVTSFSGVGIVKPKKAKAALADNVYCKTNWASQSFQLNGETYYIRIHNIYTTPGSKNLLIDYKLPKNYRIYCLSAENVASQNTDDRIPYAFGDGEVHYDQAITVTNAVGSDSGKYCLFASRVSYSTLDERYHFNPLTDTCHVYFYDDSQNPIVTKFEMGSDNNSTDYVNNYDSNNNLIGVPSSFYKDSDVKDFNYMLKHISATFQIGDNDSYNRNNTLYYCITKDNVPPNDDSSLWKKVNLKSANTSIVLKGKLSNYVKLKTEEGLIGNYYVHVMDSSGLKNTSKAVHIGKLIYKYWNTNYSTNLFTAIYFGLKGVIKGLTNQN